MSARWLIRLGAGTSGVLVALAAAHSQGGPSQQIQRQALASVAYVEADQCRDRQPRGGTGFVFERPGQIITAHHVVGGCSTVVVTYPERVVQGPRRFPATITRVYASGDLALLAVATPPPTQALRIASSTPDKTKVHVGVGYQNGELSPEAVAVTFSPSDETRLNAFLPVDAQQELSRSRSLIDTNREVLRFNLALQPGMSGGPIINQSGEVVGIVAGGLKAGTVPASWGWPAEWLASLLTSRESTDTPVFTAGIFFTLRDLRTIATAIQTDRTIRCGALDFYIAVHGHIKKFRGGATISVDCKSSRNIRDKEISIDCSLMSGVTQAALLRSCQLVTQ